MRYEVELRDSTDVFENGTNAASDQMGALHIQGPSGKVIAVYAPGMWLAVRETNHVAE